MSSNKLKIALIHPALMDYRLNLFNMLSKEYNVNFIFTKQGLGQEGVREQHLNIPVNWNYKILKSNIILLGIDIGMIIRLMKEIIFVDYDVVVISTSKYICWPLSKITKKKIVYWTEFWFWDNNSMVNKFMNNYTHYIAKHSDAVLATGTRAFTEHLKIGVENEKMFTHPQCSANYDHCLATNLKNNLGLTKKKVILFVGRIVEVKGLPYLIKAFKQVNIHMNNAFLIVIGTGPLEEYCRDLARDLGIKNILFAGFVGDEKSKADFYETCDLFVLPSIFVDGDYEPWGLVINEAMGFGKPIITTDAVGAGDDMVINEFNGCIVPNKNIEALSESILGLLSNDSLLLKMGAKSKYIYNKKNVHENLFKTFKRAIDYASYGTSSQK